MKKLKRFFMTHHEYFHEFEGQKDYWVLKPIWVFVIIALFVTTFFFIGG